MHLPASDAEKIDVALSEGDGESLFILHPGRKAGFLSVCAALPFEPVSVFSETGCCFFRICRFESVRDSARASQKEPRFSFSETLRVVACGYQRYWMAI